MPGQRSSRRPGITRLRKEAYDVSEQPRIVHGRMYENGPFYPRQYVPAGAEPSIGAPALSDKDVAALREAFLRKVTGPPKLLTPLPRRVRLRLAVTRAINCAAFWLIDRKLYGTAERLWRLFGMWR